MALENKKSILQPQSVEVQQFRLKESRLVNTVDTPIAFANQARSAAPARPSLFALNPADTVGSGDVVLSNTSTGTDNSSNGVSTSEIVYSEKAADFDGSFFFTASNPDLGFGTPSGSYAVAVMFKPDTFKAGHTQTIFHTYTGSFASHSLELSLAQGGDLHLKYSHNGGYIRYRVQEKQYRNSVGKSTNGYTFVEFHKADTPQYLVNQGTILTEGAHMVNFNGAGYMGTRNRSARAALVNTASFDISNNDNFYIGGTAATSNANFSGSIAFIRFGNSLLSSDYLKLRDGDKDVSATVDFQGVGAAAARAYTFTDNPATASIEYTGSLATTQVPLGMNVHSSSYVYVSSYK